MLLAALNKTLKKIHLLGLNSKNKKQNKPDTKKPEPIPDPWDDPLM